MMTAGARHGAVAGKHGIKEQVAPEIDLLGGKSIASFGQTGFRATDSMTTQCCVRIVERNQLADVALKAFKTGRTSIRKCYGLVCGDHRLRGICSDIVRGHIEGCAGLYRRFSS